MTAFGWENGTIELSFAADDDGPVRLVGIGAPGATAPEGAAASHQPMVEILTFDRGRNQMSYRYIGTEVGAGLRYLSHSASTVDSARGTPLDRLEILQHEARTGLVVTTTFEAHRQVAAVRTWTRVSTENPQGCWLSAVTSFATGAVVSYGVGDLDLWQGRSAWSAEHRWQSTPVRSQGLTASMSYHQGGTALVRHEVTTVGSWSSGLHVPAGAIENRVTGEALAWQVEHNGAWHWEVGENPSRGSSLTDPPPVGSAETEGPPSLDRLRDGAYVAVLGPTDSHHQWSLRVDPDTSFDTIPVTFTVGSSLDEALGNLTDHRRRSRREHPQNAALPVVFNDYMNTLNGDPTEDKLRPLIEAAGQVGAEYFCIDAGWYDDTAGWWSSVGDWLPSTVRFPSGFAALIDGIRDHGMVPGLWLEPEVVGVTSAAATELPDDAFLQRRGVRIREHDRYLLDLRSRSARAHLDAAVDRLVGDFGIGFFKLDYNVTPGAGTDVNCVSVGHGLLEHNRALITWLAGVLDRHPDLVLENCASGAMRSDFAMLSVLQMQSTSDQQDPLLYPAIAVGALAHVLPEQAGNWSYPQPDMSDEEIVFTMCTGLAGRLYQAGLLHRLSEDQRALVAHGVAVHKQTRSALATSRPRFPTGLPTWDQPWTSVAFDGDDQTYVLVWRQPHAATSVDLALPHLSGQAVSIEQIYPDPSIGSPWSISAIEVGLHVEVTDRAPAARMLRLTTR